MKFLAYSFLLSRSRNSDSKSHPEDLSDKEWEQIEPILKANTYRNAGTRCKYARREMLYAIFYLLRTGSSFSPSTQRAKTA
ncbi:transposase [Estrella lausannensis]|uniref:transposase n=1 Tax=Estrella lausannensis TaxID=483423 RepID=UPI000BF0B9DF